MVAITWEQCTDLSLTPKSLGACAIAMFAICKSQLHKPPPTNSNSRKKVAPRASLTSATCCVATAAYTHTYVERYGWPGYSDYMEWMPSCKQTMLWTAGGLAGTMLWVAVDEKLRRSCKVMWLGTKIWWKYLMLDNAHTDKENPEYLSAKSQLHSEQATESLAVIKELQGYYIKMAQTMVGAGVLPPEYEQVYRELLENCPHKDIEEIKAILLRTGIDQTDVFEQFDETPVGAASIGQVHLATLKGGQRVAVKVQYPEVEKYFKMDLAASELLMLCSGYGSAGKDMMEGIASSFEAEFDYTKEAKLQLGCYKNLPAVDHVSIPQVFEEHSNKKVLCMAIASGKSLVSSYPQLIEMWATVANQTVEEYTATATQSFMAEMAKPQFIFDSSNGATVLRALFDIHTDQIFVHGLFNSDPHAGNIFIDMEQNCKLGLIDYGAACEINPDDFYIDPRYLFAMIIVEVFNNLNKSKLDDADHDVLFKAVTKLGLNASGKAENVKKYVLAYTYVMFGYAYSDANNVVLKHIGIPEDSLGLGPLDMYVGSIATPTEMSAELCMLQRCTMVLLGVAALMGVTGVCAADVLKRAADDYLQTDAAISAAKLFNDN